jgi:hypothetical protein
LSCQHLRGDNPRRKLQIVVKHSKPASGLAAGIGRKLLTPLGQEVGRSLCKRRFGRQSGPCFGLQIACLDHVGRPSRDVAALGRANHGQLGSFPRVSLSSREQTKPPGEKITPESRKGIQRQIVHLHNRITHRTTGLFLIGPVHRRAEPFLWNNSDLFCIRISNVRSLSFFHISCRDLRPAGCTHVACILLMTPPPRTWRLDLQD